MTLVASSSSRAGLRLAGCWPPTRLQGSGSAWGPGPLVLVGFSPSGPWVGGGGPGIQGAPPGGVSRWSRGPVGPARPSAPGHPSAASASPPPPGQHRPASREEEYWNTEARLYCRLLPNTAVGASLIDRPGVAGAVLLTPLLIITSQSSRHHKWQTVRARKLTF